MGAFEVVKNRRVHKNERVNIRVSTGVKETLVRAAEATGRSLTDFVAFSAFSAAQKTIEEAERLRLADEDRAVFMDALANPPEPNEALKGALARYQKHFE